MPLLTTMQTNFTAGEIDPKIMARVDVAKYFNGLETAKNLLLMPQGGVMRRPGLRFVAEVKDSSAAVELVPFIFSQDQSYVLEGGELYLRFFAAHGQVMSAGLPYEIASPFTAAKWGELGRTQSADTLFAAHQLHQPGKLIRRDHTDWVYQNITHRPGGIKTRRHDSTETLTLSAVTGFGVTATSSGPFFQSGDVGRVIRSGSGLGVITTFNPLTPLEVLIDIIDDFASVGPIAAADWWIEGSPTGDITVAAALKKRYGVGSISSSLNSFRTEDVGKFISAYNGFFLITGYSTPAAVTARNLKETDDFSAATALWDMWQDSWFTNNYPGLVTFHDNRLLYGPTPEEPLTIWGSVTGDFVNFIIGTGDADAINFTLTADRIDRLLWMLSEDKLLVGSPGGVWNVTGKDGYLTAASPPTPKLQPKVGTAAVQPVIAGSMVLFLQKSAQQIRELTYALEFEKYIASNLTMLSTHITKPAITKLSYAAEPLSLLWALRSDGVVPAMTYEREEKVAGWTRGIETDGVVENIVIIPYGNRDELWVVVRRTINGATKRYIEYLEDMELPETQADWFFVDSGLTFTNAGAPVSTITGLEHLEGKEVAVLVDGTVHPNRTVASGAIALEFACVSKAQVGLPYESLGRTMPLEVGGEVGTAQGRIKRVVGLRARFYRSCGCEVGEDLDNLEQLFQRQVATPMGTPEPEYTGDIPREGGFQPFRGDFNPHAQIYFRQQLPLPMTVAGLVAQVEISGE